MTYVWSETTGKYTGSLSTTNPRILRIASQQLLATEQGKAKESKGVTKSKSPKRKSKRSA